MKTSFKPIWIGIITNLLAIILISKPSSLGDVYDCVFNIRTAYLSTLIIFGVAGYYLILSKVVKELSIITIGVVAPLVAYTVFLCYIDSASWFVIIFLPLAATLGFVGGTKVALHKPKWLAYSLGACIVFVLVYVPNANNLYFINRTNAEQSKLNYSHLVTANGQRIDSTSLQGKVVVVEWIGTTIDPELISKKQTSYSKYKGNPNFALYFVTKGQPRAMSNLNNILYDTEGNFFKYFLDTEEHFTSVIGKNGVLQWFNTKEGFSEDPFVIVAPKDRWIDLLLAYQ